MAHGASYNTLCVRQVYHFAPVNTLIYQYPHRLCTETLVPGIVRLSVTESTSDDGTSTTTVTPRDRGIMVLHSLTLSRTRIPLRNTRYHTVTQRTSSSKFYSFVLHCLADR